MVPPEQARRREANVRFTVGVEEEYHVVDAATGALRSAPQVVPAAKELLGEAARAEIGTAQLEMATPVCDTLGEVRAQLRRLRAGANAAASRFGCRILPAATHPFSRWDDQQLTAEPRYVALFERWGLLALQQHIAGCHVHVAVDDVDLAVRVMDRARPHLPTLLALSASSPFWEGVDTGYASYRAQWFSRWPIAGAPQALGSRAAYDELVARLVRIGVIDDASHLYWDVRPSLRYPTVEFRIGDVCPSLDDAVLHAGLVRSLVRTLVSAECSGAPGPQFGSEVLRAARWRAARYGLEERLVDPATLELRPAPAVVADLLALLRPDLQDHGEWPEVTALAAQLLRRGSSAARQRKTAADGGGDLAALALALVAEGQGLFGRSDAHV